MDFDLSPLLVVWEVTQACDLACVHCRASERPDRDPGELSTEEARRFLEEVKEFGNPLMVLTGGDPLKRPDIFDLVRHSVATGLRTNITPSATPLLTAESINQFQTCGISRMAINLDGPDAPTHDGFRQVDGSYDRAIFALRHARDIGLDTQVQTNVARTNLATLGHIAELVADVRAKMWSLFFPVSTGPSFEELAQNGARREAVPDTHGGARRALWASKEHAQNGARHEAVPDSYGGARRALCASEEDLNSDDYEKVFEFLYEISKVAPFEVKTTEGLHYRRYIAQRLKAEHGGRGGLNGRLLWRTTAVSEGRGFLFISHTGEIYPSGYLPVSAGNVRGDSIVDVYRNSRLFRILREPAAREGKCAYCEYHKICGGSRARAWAMTGNYLEADPRCCYQPSNQPDLVSV